MKKQMLLLLFVGTACFYSSGTDKINTLLKTLDEQIQKDKFYISIKENNIALLKTNTGKGNISKDDRYFMNKSLYKEYKSYISDSAIFYLNQNLVISESLNSPYKTNETHLLFATLFQSLGLYPEAMDALGLVRKEFMDKTQRVDYYMYYMDVFGGIALYTQDNVRKAKYWKLHNVYRDSLYSIMIPNSPEYLRIEENRIREKGLVEEAIAINDQRLKLVPEKKEEYALIMFHRALIYRKMDNIEKQKECLILSSLSDIECAIKDNASISLLAHILFQEGDIERAYNYIRFSLNSTHMYNTRLRSSSTLSTLAIIDKTYHEKSERQNNRLHLFMVLICTLFVILVVLSFFIYRQLQKKAKINKYVMKTNMQLNELNRKLKEMNIKLEKTNLEVVESNKIKEEYIGYFLNQCVQYIDKIDNFRKMVNKKIQEKQIDILYNITQSQMFREDELKELFRNFDRMFLKLFPDFINDFNALLSEKEQVTLKKDEILNIELRIYALIRLGISDSNKIANFLGYSINTIYNYRARIKNKAKFPKENFEHKVKRIGAFK